MSLLTDNFHSPIIRAYYQDQQRQAIIFLHTVGAKALVLQEQKETDLTTYYGIHEEAELRYKIVNTERIRSIKRKLLEKESIRVIKCARNGKYRIIELIIEHSKKTETYVVWLSRYNYLKKFLVDKHTQINILQKPSNQSMAQVLDISNVATTTVTGSGYNWTSSSIRISGKFQKIGDPTTVTTPRSRKSTELSSVVPSSSSPHSSPRRQTFPNSLILDQPLDSTSNESPERRNSLDELQNLPLQLKQFANTSSTIQTTRQHIFLPRHRQQLQHQQQQQEQQRQQPPPPLQHYQSDIIPIRLKNSMRVLDLFFFNQLEMEAFIMVLHRYSSINITSLSHLFCHSANPQ